MRDRLRFSSRLALPVLLVITSLLYAPTLSYGFAYDDLWQVPLSTWSRVLLEFQPSIRDYPDYFRPVFIASTWLQRQVWGLNPTGYHLVNWMLHLANVVLLFYLVKRISGRRGTAFGTALIWNLLPSTAYSVAWLAQLNDLLAAFFVLLSALTAIHFFQTRSLAWGLVTAVSYGLGLLSKEMAVPLVFVLWLGVWRQESTRGPFRALLRVCPHVLVLAGYAGTRYAFTGYLLPPPVIDATVSYETSPLSQWVVTGLHYVEVLGQHLVPVYELPSRPVAILFVVLVMLAGWLVFPTAWRFWRGVVSTGETDRLAGLYPLGLAWFGSFSIVAAMAWGHPRLLYIPSLGFAAAVAASLTAAWEQVSAARRRAVLSLAVAGLALLNLVMVFEVQSLFAPSSPKVLDYHACYTDVAHVVTELSTYAQTELVKYGANPRCSRDESRYWERLTVNDLYQTKYTQLRPLILQGLRAWLDLR